MKIAEYKWRAFVVEVMQEREHRCGYLRVPREYRNAASSIGSTDAPVVEETPAGEDRLTLVVEHDDGTTTLGWDYGHTYCADRSPPLETIIREGVALAAVVVDRRDGQRRARAAFREVFGLDLE